MDPNTPSSPTPIQPTQPQGTEPTDPAPSPGVVTPMQALPKPGRGKKLALAGGVVAVMVAGVVAYMVGFYLPNRPANVFATALERTGENYDKLASYLNDAGLAKKYENGQANGTFKLKSADFSTDGSFEAKGDANNGTFKADMGLVTTRLKVETILKDAPNSESPDAYLKMSGIKGFGTQAGMPGLDSLDNQWIEIDHSLFDTIANQYSQKQDGVMKAPPKEDMKEFYDVLGNVGHKYLFTGSKNAVFEMREFVGNETVDGRKTLHYKVGVNKENYKKFAEELDRELDKTKLNNWVKENADGRSFSAIFNTKKMAKDADTIKADDTADLWVYADDKTVHKVRFSDKKNAEKYTEFGLGTQDTDKHPIFIKMKQDADTTVDLSASLDTRTHSLRFQAAYTNGKGTKASSASFDMTVEPYDGKVEAKAPANAMTLNEALSKIGLDAYLNLLVSGQLNQSNANTLPLPGLENQRGPLYNIQ